MSYDYELDLAQPLLAGSYSIDITATMDGYTPLTRSFVIQANPTVVQDTVRTLTDLLTVIWRDGQAPHELTAQDVRDTIISLALQRGDFSRLPTLNAGLPTGRVYIDNGVVKVNLGFGPQTAWHYAPNANWPSNFDPNLTNLGFNLADVASAGLLPFLPSGTKALVYVGNPNGADSTFTSLMTACQPYLSSIFAFYLADTADPDPAGTWGVHYTAANLKAQADYIHTNFPGAKTFIWLANLGSSYSPAYDQYNGFPGYTPATTDIDYYGLAGYAVRDDLVGGFDTSIIGLNYNAAIAAGIPKASIVPTYQAFGLGNWGAPYEIPTAAQLTAMINAWGAVTPTPVFDYFYAWGPQNNDTAMISLPDLQQVARQHNLP